ncbi:hypothetical protein OIU89_00965 [Escherichia coli]|nr:hypothetical protein [Escherichia coli]
MLTNYPAHSCWLFFNEIERHHCHFQTLRLFRKVRAFLTDSVFGADNDSLTPLPWVMVKSIALGLSLRNN